MTSTDHDSGKVRRGDVTRHTTHTARECVVVYGRADESDSDDFVVLGDSDESDRHVNGLH